MGGVIMYSYQEIKVKIIAQHGATEEIRISRGVKEGCQLSLVLFDICIDPLMEKLTYDQYKRDVFPGEEQ
jgi:hypothetical protein